MPQNPGREAISSETWQRLGVSCESLERLTILVGVVETWQRRINLIAPSTIAQIWTRHILDSAQLLPLIHGSVTAISDLGSGAGFPGLVLAATQPAMLHLFEANAKKVAFLQEALRAMKIEAVVHHQRLLTHTTGSDLPRVQLVTARAFAPLADLLAYAKPFFDQGASGLFHKGQDVDAELTQAAKSWNITVQKHCSITDSKAVILDVKEIIHVDGN